jgi:hypothetical protein
MLFNRWNRGRARGPITVARSAPWVVFLLLLAGAVFGLGTSVLQLDSGTSLGLAGFAAAMFLLVAWLPETGTRLNAAVHVALTFHFTVLSRVFFRADDLDTSRGMIAGLLRMDTHGVRPGLLTPWLWAALIGGVAYHMITPKRWVEIQGYALFRRLPGVVIGLLFAALALGVHLLLANGPRPNIYFSF